MEWIIYSTKEGFILCPSVPYCWSIYIKIPCLTGFGCLGIDLEVNVEIIPNV